MHQTTKQYVIPLCVGTLFSLAGFIGIILYSDPYLVGAIIHTLFYVTLFLWVTGVFTIGGLLVRKKFYPGIFISQFEISLRQSILISLFTVSCLLLESFNLLFWWVGLTLLLFILTVEFFFGSN